MFQFHNLEYSDFEHLFSADESLSSKSIITIADANPGFPCRVSLDFAPIGTRMLLTNHAHHNVESPYDSKYAIFISENATPANLGPNELPPFFKRKSPIALRGFDSNGFLKRADIATAPETAPLIDDFFETKEIAYIHAHFAAYGCFAARITRS